MHIIRVEAKICRALQELNFASLLKFNFTVFYMFRPESEERAVGATYCASIKELLQRSDFVMVVVNLSPQTHKLIGAKEFAMMKPNSTLINISRGNVIGCNKAI